MDPTHSDETTPRARRRLFPLGVIVYAGGAFLLFAVVIEGSLRLVGRGFPGFLVWDNGALVAIHGGDWTGWTANLPLNGGVLVTVDGRPFEGGLALFAHAARLEPGTPVRYGVRWQGTVREYVVPTMGLSGRQYALTLGSYLFTAATLFIVGALALALRPDALNARSLAMATGTLGVVTALVIDYITAYRFITLFEVIEALAPAAVLHFALVFPVERISAPRRRGLIGGLAVLFLAGAVLEAKTFHTQPEFSRSITLGFYVLVAVVGVGIVASLAEASVRAPSPKERMQAAVVFAGALTGFVPPAAAILSFSLLGWSYSWTWFAPFVAIFPIAVLYAIVRHDLLGAERFVRLGIGYAIVTAGIVLVYAVVLQLLVNTFRLGTEASAEATFVLFLVIAVSFEPMRRRVQKRIDRTFYRLEVDLAQALEESSGQLAGLGSEAEIAEHVGGHLRRTLVVEWAELRVGASDATEAAVSECVAFRGDRLGVIACGPKGSGAPFSEVERDFVKGIASQAAIALHNARTIQALRQAQETLLRTARLTAIGEFAGSVAHGIRNPLAGIRSAAQLAHRHAGRGSLADGLAGVLAEVDRLDHRIRSLLEFSRPYDLSLRKTDLREILESVRKALGPQVKRVGVKVDVRLPAAPVKLEVDPDYLEEALLELASNAIRAMPDGGTLGLRAERDDSRVFVFVSDTGSGIPEAVRERVFDLFFSTRGDGTGMGLASVKKITEAHGGAIEILESSPRGTVFRIRLV